MDGLDRLIKERPRSSNKRRMRAKLKRYRHAYREGKIVVDGVWVRDRRLNGDETAVISADAPTLLRMKVFCYA